MNTLYEYIDPITSPYEAFCSDSQKWPLPIPSHWHYYIEIIYHHYMYPWEFNNHCMCRFRCFVSSQMHPLHCTLLQGNACTL